MSILANALVLAGFPAFVVGTLWMFTGKAIFFKNDKRNLETQGMYLLFAGFALLFTGVGIY